MITCLGESQMSFTLSELVPAVRTALQQWYSGKQPEHVWNDMRIVAACAAQISAPDLGFAVKQIMLDALDTLNRERGQLAEILRLRFLDDLTAQEVAHQLNLSENVVYKRQQAAIKALAAILWRQEQAARAAHTARICARLELAQPPQLFGADEKLEALVHLLLAPGAPWLIAVVGIGGIGKTSLADAAVRRVAGAPVFADMAWVSARQSSWLLASGENAVARPALTYAGLLDALVSQFEFQDLAHGSTEQKQQELQARLQARPALVVIDNLETAADYGALLPHLDGLSKPTRFLLTCRHRLDDYAGVYNLSLDELSAQDSLALIRHQAAERGLSQVAAAPDESLLQICQVAGGNPLALKLLVGQMFAFSIPQIVQDMRQARGKTVQELYRHIYWRAWHLLAPEAQQVLAVMPLVAETGGGIEQISTLSEVGGEQLTEAIKQLVTLSLIDVRGAVDARRYGIHRLTETFLLNEVVRWQTQP